MNQYEYKDLLPEERGNYELLVQLQNIYRTTSEDEQSLNHLRKRWYKMRQEASSKPNAISPRPKNIQARINPHTREDTKGRAWLRLLNALAAILVVCLVTGAFLFTISALKQRTETPATPGEGTSGIWLGFRQTLVMFDEQVGWMMDNQLSAKEGYAPVWHTTDGGKHWQQVTPNLTLHQEFSWSLYVRDKMTAWLITRYDGERYAALYRTLDGGKTWQRFDWPYASEPLDFLTFTDQNHGWSLLVTLPFAINLGDVRKGNYMSETDTGLQQFCSILVMEEKPGKRLVLFQSPEGLSKSSFLMNTRDGSLVRRLPRKKAHLSQNILGTSI